MQLELEKTVFLYIQPVAAISRAIKSLRKNKDETQTILVHTDTAQAIGKVKVNVDDLGVDYLTVVGHKVGCIIIRFNHDQAFKIMFD